MYSENPNHILQQQEQYQAAVLNATKQLRSAVIDAQLAVSESFQAEKLAQEIPIAHQNIIDHSLKKPASISDIANNAFQKAKEILNDAFLNVEISQALDEHSQVTPETQMPTLPGFPDPEMTSQNYQSDTDTPADLLSQNMKWMDTSMLQLFESMNKQPDSK